MPAKFEIFQNGCGYGWRLRAPSGTVIAQLDGFVSGGAALAGVVAAQAAADGAEIEDHT